MVCFSTNGILESMKYGSKIMLKIRESEQAPQAVSAIVLRKECPLL